jgi:hypothetical protein
MREILNIVVGLFSRKGLKGLLASPGLPLISAPAALAGAHGLRCAARPGERNPQILLMYSTDIDDGPLNDARVAEVMGSLHLIVSRHRGLPPNPLASGSAHATRDCPAGDVRFRKQPVGGSCGRTIGDDPTASLKIARVHLNALLGTLNPRQPDPGAPLGRTT